MNTLQWLQLILSYIMQASLVIGVAWALECRTHAARTKTRIWTGCFISLLGLLVIGLLLPRLQWVHPWSQLGPRELLVVAGAEHVLGRSLLAVWFLGFLVMLSRWVIQFVGLRRFMASCTELGHEKERALRMMARRELLQPNGRPVTFRISPEEIGPFCYQFHQPIVFLPKSLVDGDKVELQHVLHHELTHLQTQHPMQLFSQKLVQALLWFHPLVWISGRRASLVREFVCDDAATSGGASTASYLRTLLRIVEDRSTPQRSTLAMGRSPSELKVRARRLVSAPATDVSRWGGLASVGVFVGAVLASQVWLPTNPLSSPQTRYSPWPSWSANTLHTFGVSARDFEHFDAHLQMHELFEDCKKMDLEGS